MHAPNAYLRAECTVQYGTCTLISLNFHMAAAATAAGDGQDQSYVSRQPSVSGHLLGPHGGLIRELVPAAYNGGWIYGAMRHGALS